MNGLIDIEIPVELIEPRSVDADIAHLFARTVTPHPEPGPGVLHSTRAGLSGGRPAGETCSREVTAPGIRTTPQPLTGTSAAPEPNQDPDQRRPATVAASTAAAVVRFTDITDPAQRAKVVWRESVVQAVMALEAGNKSRRAAIMAVLETPLGAAASRSAVYGWLDAYASCGIDGLVEQKKGKVGRTSFVETIPQNLMEKAVAAAVEHGTLGPDGRQNFARSVRNYLMEHPDLPSPAREHLHDSHASKSYVARSLRDRLRVSPLARAMVQGPDATRLAAPHIPSLCDCAPGRVITADDMTANVYCWVEAPTAHGYIIGRPQVLAWLDVGSHRWMQARLIMRQSGQYTRDDVWGGIGDVMAEYGVFPEWLFEGGIWRSNVVIGERTGISDESRFGGLKSLGCKLHHSRRPQSKPIEQAFNQLQYQADAFPGYCGRDERRDGPDHLQRILYETKRGKLHPRGVLPHYDQFKAHVQQCLAALNGERQDGRALRGASPDEAWQAAGVNLPRLTPEAAWMFRSAVARVTVRRSGDVLIRQRSGKWTEEYLYRNPELLLRRAGQTLLAYWNDRNPDADCVLMTATPSPELIGVAHYVRPISRFDATDEELAAAAHDRKEAMAFARAEVIKMKPHFERSAERLQSAPTVAEVAQIGRQLQASEERAERAEVRRDQVRDQVRREGAQAADELLTPRRDAESEESERHDGGDELLDALRR